MKLGIKRGRTIAFWSLGAAIVFAVAVSAWIFFRIGSELLQPAKIDPAFQLTPAIELAALPTATRFDFPLGSENGALTYNAQPFTQNRHLGDDLNGIGGENSDLGDSVYAVADGRVLEAREAGPGWGNIVIVLHAYVDNGERKYVQSYYAHLQTMLVKRGDDVRRGQRIGTVGTANGRYFAHLHFEMREFITPFVGPGYREETRGWLDPTAFIKEHRGAPDDDVGRLSVP